jgi:putative oxidoreductase
MRQVDAEDFGKLVLRLTIGILLLFHANGFFHGDRGIPTVVAAWGLPPFFAYVGVLLEVIGCASIILGLYAQLGALALVLFMLAAIVMVHVVEVPGLHGSGNHLLLRGSNPAGVYDKYFLESQALYLLGAVSIVLLGAGRLSLSHRLNLDVTFGRKRPGAALQNR